MLVFSFMMRHTIQWKYTASSQVALSKTSRSGSLKFSSRNWSLMHIDPASIINQNNSARKARKAFLHVFVRCLVFLELEAGGRSVLLARAVAVKATRTCHFMKQSRKVVHGSIRTVSTDTESPQRPSSIVDAFILYIIRHKNLQTGQASSHYVHSTCPSLHQ